MATWRQWLEKWKMTELRINFKFLDMTWEPHDADKNAAWQLYIELLTRITTQPLRDEDGDEAAALKSIYSLFALTRETIKSNGRECEEFTKIAIVVLNQVIRPFTARWHRRFLEGQLAGPAEREAFRSELEELRAKLVIYAGMLADMAGVEDLSALENPEM